MTALLPCPFCGQMLIKNGLFSRRNSDCYVHPQDIKGIDYGRCPANGFRLYSNDAERIALWNLRAATAGPAIGPSSRLDEPETVQSNPSLGTGGEAWRPIETAPRDGTSILGYDARKTPAAGLRVVWWSAYFRDEEGWLDDFDGEPDPTHWLPLPAPPPVPTISGGGEGDQGDTSSISQIASASKSAPSGSEPSAQGED